MLTGTGTAGAYHAGVLRSLREAGVKIDLVAGRGIGAVAAMYSAIDGGGRLWGKDGLWCGAGAKRLYRLRGSLRIVCVLGIILALALLALWLSPIAVPTHVLKGTIALLICLPLILSIDAVLTVLRRVSNRRARGGLWWRLLGTPVDGISAVNLFTDGLWQAMSGSTNVKKPTHDDFGERYAELLGEHVGQPGFRELLVLTHDVDARRDAIFSLLDESYRTAYMESTSDISEGSRQLEVVDLSQAPRRHAMDALLAAISIPVFTEPHFVRYSAESVWRGETHRLCDRPDGLPRLLEEVARAGVQQVIIVSACSPSPGPHALGVDRLDMRGRAGQYLESLESASLHDAIAGQASKFQGIFQVRPVHNPLGPFDFKGCYDEQSDRRQTLDELVGRGYEDGCSQFVVAVVGESGELIDAPSMDRPLPNPSLSERMAAHKDSSDSTLR